MGFYLDCTININAGQSSRRRHTNNQAALFQQAKCRKTNIIHIRITLLLSFLSAGRDIDIARTTFYTKASVRKISWIIASINFLCTISRKFLFCKFGNSEI